MGLILSVMVHTADVQDRDGARLAVEQIKRHLRCLKVVFADGGYAGQLVTWFKETVGWKLAIVKRSEHAKGFEVLPKRWIVERTFAWLNLYRRHSKDYEELPANSEAMIYITMIRLMTRRLARQRGNQA
jgi:putative transposase